MKRYGACLSVCIGLILIVWSVLVLGGVQAVTIGTRVDWVAGGGAVIGVLLLIFGVWRIFRKR